MFRYTGMRFALTLIIVSIVMIVMGLGEAWRCCRALAGPTRITYSQATSQGLAGYGYVRVTGVRANLERAAVVVKENRGMGSERWDCAYVPMLDAAADDATQCTLLAHLPRAHSEEDIGALETLDGPNNDEFTGFVECPYDRLDPWHVQNVASKVGADARRCWVVDATRPSWLRGLGLTLGGLAIPGVWVAWRLKKGFVD
jgi:hypothetical protein